MAQACGFIIWENKAEDTCEFNSQLKKRKDMKKQMGDEMGRKWQKMRQRQMHQGQSCGCLSTRQAVMQVLSFPVS